MTITRVSVPGEVTATYEDGRITALVFMPHGSNAGWFGPAAELEEGDDTLDLEDVTGPFWRAMQAYLADHLGPEWQE